MKKTIAVLLILLISVSLVLQVYAGPGDEVLAEQNKDYIDECNDIRLAVRAGAGGNFSEVVDFGLMYRCYKLSNENFVKAYEEDGSFSKNISDSYSWVIPKCAESGTSSSGEVTVVESNDIEFGWVIRGGVNYQADEGFISPDYVSVCNRILESHPGADRSSICAVDSVNLDCRLFFFSDNGVEYLMPLFLSGAPEWAENGAICDVGEFVEKAKASFPDTPEQKDGFFKNMKNNLDYIIAATVIVLIILVVIGFYIKKRKKTEDE